MSVYLCWCGDVSVYLSVLVWRYECQFTCVDVEVCQSTCLCWCGGVSVYLSDSVEVMCQSAIDQQTDRNLPSTEIFPNTTTVNLYKSMDLQASCCDLATDITRNIAKYFHQDFHNSVCTIIKLSHFPLRQVHVSHGGLGVQSNPNNNEN